MSKRAASEVHREQAGKPYTSGRLRSEPSDCTLEPLGWVVRLRGGTDTAREPSAGWLACLANEVPARRVSYVAASDRLLSSRYPSIVGQQRHAVQQHA